MVNFCSHTLQDFCKAKPTGNAPSPGQQYMQTSWHDQCGKLALKSEAGNCCFIAKARTFGTSARWHRWCTKPPCRAITVSTFKVHAWNLKNSESKLIVSSRHPAKLPCPHFCGFWVSRQPPKPTVPAAAAPGENGGNTHHDEFGFLRLSSLTVHGWNVADPRIKLMGNPWFDHSKTKEDIKGTKPWSVSPEGKKTF